MDTHKLHGHLYHSIHHQHFPCHRPCPWHCCCHSLSLLKGCQQCWMVHHVGPVHRSVSDAAKGDRNECVGDGLHPGHHDWALCCRLGVNRSSLPLHNIHHVRGAGYCRLKPGPRDQGDAIGRETGGH